MVAARCRIGNYLPNDRGFQCTIEPILYDCYSRSGFAARFFAMERSCVRQGRAKQEPLSRMRELGTP
jgi:hypothetical protein